jgi:formate-dependent nitrite reductase membrane component NrfD
MRQPDIASESGLDALREEASRTGEVKGAGVVLGGAPFPRPNNAQGYYGIPLLKEPVWTWQVPLYFFVGGAAGASAVIGFFAHVFGTDPSLARAALRIALGGGLLCPLLLVADLGRPIRFLNMLRVFKLRSPMSVGAWTLVLFSSAITLAVASGVLMAKGYDDYLLAFLRWAGEMTAALSGVILISYTGVLLAVTAVPVWSENRALLPPTFVASGLGSAAGILELLGFLNPVTQALGIVAAGTETLIGGLIEVRRRPVDEPLRSGRTGWALLAAEALAGPISLFLRIGWASDPIGRKAAAACFLAGALTIRYAWLAAGRASARDLKALFEVQSKFPETKRSSAAER